VLAGTVITCPWHAWRYDVITGTCKTNPQSRIKTFAVEVKDGQVYVNV
jgi:nitrite reductase/ring-hydroxylating ferredoxin subunit